MTDLPPDNAVRVERARADFVKGVVRPDAPGMVYYPNLKELAEKYDLIESVLARRCNEDDWLDARREAMTHSAITPYSAAVDADPNIAKRSEIVAREMESFDDKMFGLSRRITAVAEKAVEQLELEDDPVRAIRALRSVAQTMESVHRIAKTAYDPASQRPDNTVNININQAPVESVIAQVAEIYAKAEQQAIAAGVDPETIEDADIVDDPPQGCKHG